MRELSISFDNSGKAVLDSVHNYRDEHRAVCLAITLSEDLLAAGADEYYLSFVQNADAENPMPQKMTVGPVQDIREGTLRYELPSFLTDTACLAVQLDAVKKGEDGSVASLVKSPVFRISLDPSLQGEELLPQTHETDGLIERLLNAAAQTLAVKDSVAASFAQGAFHAKINGHDAITLQGGINLNLTDANGVVTLDCSTLPMVSSLPQSPSNGDVVLLLAQNEITVREAQAELRLGADMLAAVAESERQVMLQDPTSRCPIYFNLRKSGSLVGFVSLTSDWEEDDFGQPKHVCLISFVTGMRGGQPREGIEIAYINGVFSAARSVFIHNGIASALDAVPTAVRLPDFDAVEEVARETLPLPVFFAPASLWVYRSRWLEVTSVSEPRHYHDNKATIDCFNCDAVEAVADTPAGQPVLAQTYTGWDRLRWGGNEVRMVDDGGVVDRVETVTVNNKSFLRLWLDYGEVQTIQAGVTRPDYIDIPIDSAIDSTVTQGALTLNGTELDLGVGSLEADAHTHANKAVLDDLGSVYLVPNTAIKSATYETLPVNNVRPMEAVGDGYNGALYAGVPLVFQAAQTQPITITALTNNVRFSYPEYVIEFTTGATAPTLTLPASVAWADELTVEANKHYQISIVNDIALWCAVDLEAEEEEE